MPYIPRDRRDAVEPCIHGDAPATAGEVNYLLTRTCTDYLDAHGLSYATINDVVGALECAKQEFYRRVAVPYEGMKIALNGDVYESSLRRLNPND